MTARLTLSTSSPWWPSWSAQASFLQSILINHALEIRMYINLITMFKFRWRRVRRFRLHPPCGHRDRRQPPPRRGLPQRPHLSRPQQRQRCPRSEGKSIRRRKKVVHAWWSNRSAGDWVSLLVLIIDTLGAA